MASNSEMNETQQVHYFQYAASEYVTKCNIHRAVFQQSLQRETDNYMATKNKFEALWFENERVTLTYISYSCNRHVSGILGIVFKNQYYFYLLIHAKYWGRKTTLAQPP